MIYEYSFGGKRLELLRQIAPNVTRVLVFRDPASPGPSGEFAAIQALGQTLGVIVSPIDSRRDPGEIASAVSTFAGTPNGGLIMTPGAAAAVHHDALIALALQNKLPAVYPFRYMVTSGGLACIGPDIVDQSAHAAAYVDRVLKGERPADLPVQAPTKYEVVINQKTAKALGLSIPAGLLAAADEVIE